MTTGKDFAISSVAMIMTSNRERVIASHAIADDKLEQARKTEIEILAILLDPPTEESEQQVRRLRMRSEAYRWEAEKLDTENRARAIENVLLERAAGRVTLGLEPCDYVANNASDIQEQARIAAATWPAAQIAQFISGPHAMFVRTEQTVGGGNVV